VIVYFDIESHCVSLQSGAAVEACGRLPQAHLTRRGLTDIDRSSVQNLGTACLTRLDRMWHTEFRKKMSLFLF
jgi:hypothetical protein